MKTALTIITVALLFAACKKPAATPIVPTTSVTGKILYRSACQLQSTPVPFTPPASGAGDVGPYLYLSDMTGKTVSTLVTTQLDGTFIIPRVPAGAYQLRVRAQELRNFWVGAPVATIGVIVNEDAVKSSTIVQVGTACVDNDKPNADAVRAVWGDAVTMTATRGKTLHLQASSVQTRLDVLGSDPDGDLLHARFATNSGALVPSASLSAFWPHAAGVASDNLRVLVTDGFGGNIALNLPVRLHQSRLLPLYNGGWYEFSDAATAAAVVKDTYFAGNMTTAEGWSVSDTAVVAKLAGPSDAPNYMSLRSPTPMDLTSTVVTEARFKVVQSSTNWMALAGFIAEQGNWFLGFQLYKDVVGYEWRFVDVDMNVLSSGRLEGFAGDQIALRLEIDTVRGIAKGRLQSEAQADFTVSFAVGQLAQRQVRSFAGMGSESLQDETVELAFSSIYLATLTHQYAFPSRPGTLDNLIYDQHPMVAASGSFVVTEEDSGFGVETILMDLPRLAPMATCLLQFNGRLVTVLTDSPVEKFSEEGMVVVSWDPEATYPLDGNQGILY